MRGKIVLLYESDQGKAMCDAASYVLTQIALAFSHALTLPIRRCARDQALEDEVLALCTGAAGILSGESSLCCLPALADELQCDVRVRELRYTHLMENRSLMGINKPLNTLLIQPLDSSEECLRAAARKAYLLSDRDSLPILHVAPAGKLADAWKAALEEADRPGAVFHAREAELPHMIPDMVYHTDQMGVILCPPYAGAVLSDAAAVLCGAPAMCYDAYAGGVCGLYAPLKLEDESRNPFGMLRAAHALLRENLNLEREAACLEAAARNVLQAGWRTPDVMREGCRPIDNDGITSLVCQQIEVAGEWINENNE